MNLRHETWSSCGDHIDDQAFAAMAEEIEHMSDSTSMVPHQPYTATGYQEAREALVSKMEEIAGGEINPQATQASLAFFARFERALRSGLLHAAPDGARAEEGFAVACREFLNG